MSASTRPTFFPSRASATATLAATVDLPTPPLPLATAMIVRSSFSAVIATRVSMMPGTTIIAARTRRSSCARSSADRPVASSTMVAIPSLSRVITARSPRPSIPASAAFMGSCSSLIATADRQRRSAWHCFSAEALYIESHMKRFFGWGRNPGAVMSDNRGGPWGPGGGDDGGSGGGGDGPRNPWGQPPRRRKPGRTGEVTSLDEFLKKSRDRIGRRWPPGDGRPYWLYGLIAFVVLWIAFTSVHRISPQERGVVTTFGYYDRTLLPGLRFTWPSPVGRVQKVDVEN